MALQKQPTAEFKPSDLAEYVAAFEEQCNMRVTFTWSLLVRKDKPLGWKLTLHGRMPHQTPADADMYTIPREWPTNSHKTILALMYSMLYQLDSEVRAAMTLAAMGA